MQKSGIFQTIMLSLETQDHESESALNISSVGALLSPHLVQIFPLKLDGVFCVNIIDKKEHKSINNHASEKVD